MMEKKLFNIIGGSESLIASFAGSLCLAVDIMLVMMMKNFDTRKREKSDRKDYSDVEKYHEFLAMQPFTLIKVDFLLASKFICNINVNNVSKQK